MLLKRKQWFKPVKFGPHFAKTRMCLYRPKNGEEMNWSINSDFLWGMDPCVLLCFSVFYRSQDPHFTISTEMRKHYEECSGAWKHPLHSFSHTQTVKVTWQKWKELNRPNNAQQEKSAAKRPTLLCLLPTLITFQWKMGLGGGGSFDSLHPWVFFYVGALSCLPPSSTIRWRRDVTKLFISSH